MEAKLSRGTQALGTSLTPRGLAAMPREGGKAGHPQPHAGGRAGFPPTAAGRDRRLRCCHLTGEAKERRCGPKGDNPNSPASLWAPPPLSTSWKWPSILGHGCCPALTPSWHPPVLASELQWSTWQMDPTLQEFIPTGGVSSTEHPQPGTATSHPAEGQRATGITRKKDPRGRCRASTEPRLCQAAGRAGRSHLLHPQLHPLLRQVDDHAGKVRDQGGVFPGHTHWEAGTCNSPFPLENPQLATTWQSKNTSDAPSLPAALPSTQLSNLPMPTPGRIWQFPLPADHRGQEGDTQGQLQGKATLTSGRSLCVLTASMFSEMDSTRQPAERSTKRSARPGCHQVPQHRSLLFSQTAWIQEKVQLNPPGMFRKVSLTIGYRGQLQHRVQGTFQVGHLICRDSKAGGLSHLPSTGRLRLLHPTAKRCTRQDANTILSPGTGSSPALLSRKYARRQRMTAWWQMTRTFSCLSSSMMTGSRRCTRSW